MYKILVIINFNNLKILFLLNLLIELKILF